MKSLTFANNDEMPAIGLGTWKSQPGEVGQIIRNAIDLGYRHFDCAHLYMNEKEIGEAFAAAFQAGDVKREELWVTSKVWNNCHKKHQVRPALEQTLTNLQLDYLDSYLVHWPVVLKDDVLYPTKGEDMVSLDEVPISETWAAMEACYEAGLMRHIGVSNFSIKKLKALTAIAKIKPEINQIEMQPFFQQNPMLEYCASEGINLTAYSPFGSRDRPDNFKMGDEPDLFKIPEVQEIAEAHGCTTPQVLVAWAVQRGTSIIPKSANPERMKQNLDAGDITLTDDEMAVMLSLDRNYRFIVGKFWTVEGSPYTLENLWDE